MKKVHKYSIPNAKWRQIDATPHPPKLLKGPKGGSQSVTTEEEKSWGTLPNS